MMYSQVYHYWKPEYPWRCKYRQGNTKKQQGKRKINFLDGAPTGKYRQGWTDREIKICPSAHRQE